MKEMFDLSKAIRSAVVTATLAIVTSVTAMAATGVGVQSHTQQEIKDFISSQGEANGPVQYEVQPTKPGTVSTYKLGDQGKLSQATEERALKMLKNIRYVAGLSTDVSLDADYSEYAQSAAYINDINGVMTHTPTQPEGMTDELYEKASYGAHHSNLSEGSVVGKTLTTTVLEWMSDADSNNIGSVGHRRWLLNPPMAKTGFGVSGIQYAVYAVDNSGSSGISGVVWPAQNMPVEYFANDIPWSYSAGRTVGTVKVTLTRTSDNKQWIFTNNGGSSDGYFHVDNGSNGYYIAQNGCIIFRPDGISYKTGDEFDVSITGDVTANYHVAFFSIEDPNVKDVKKATVQYFSNDTAEQVGYYNSIFSYTGNKVEPDIKVTLDGEELKAGTDYTFSYANNVDANFDTEADDFLKNNKPVPVVQITGIGEYTGYQEADGYYIGTRDIDNSHIKISIQDAQYTGNAITPDIQVTYGDDTATTDDDWTLTEGTDYEIESVTSVTNVGDEGTVTIKGIGNFYGSASKSFTVSPASIGDAEISGFKESVKYNGKPQTFDLALTFNGVPLTEGTDYSVSYSSNTDVGRANVIVSGLGNFRSSARGRFFDITPRAIGDCKSTLCDIAWYTGKPAIPSPVFVDEEMDYTLVEGVDYEISADKEITEVGDTAQVTVSGLGNYGNGAIAQIYTIVPGEITSVEIPAGETFIYDGSEQVSAGLIVKSRDTVVSSAEYTATYKDNVDAGTATVTVKGKTNFTGEKTVRFEIAKADLSAAEVSFDEDAEYDGTEKKLVPVVKLSDKMLKADDYDVAYSGDLIKIDSKVNVTVSGKGNYTGTAAGYYVIGKRNFTRAEIADIAPVEYTGEEVKPTATVTRNGVTLTEGTDYTVECSDVNAGKAVATFTGIGEYEGTLTKEFKITPQDIGKCQADAIKPQTYTGENVTPDVVLTNPVTGALTKESDYEVTYPSTNVNADADSESGAVVVTGNGNYSGTRTLRFKILPAGITSVSTPAGEEYVYDGSVKKPSSLDVTAGSLVLTESDYDVSYSVPTPADAGNVTVTVTGKGNFTGEKSTEYTIQKADFSTYYSIQAASDELVYNGQVQKPEIKVTDRSGNILSADQYLVETDPAASVDANTYSVTARAAEESNYSGTLTSVNYEIQPKKITAEVDSPEKTYDGTADADLTAHADTGVSGETMTITGLTGTFDTIRHGEGKSVTIDSTHVDISISGGQGKAANYKVTFPAYATGSIAQRDLSLKTKDQKVPFGGSVQSTVDQVEIIEGDLFERDYIEKVVLSSDSAEHEINYRDRIRLDSIVILNENGEDRTDEYDTSFSSTGFYTVVPTEAQTAAVSKVETAAGPEDSRSEAVQSIVDEATGRINSSADADLDAIVTDAVSRISEQLLSDAKDAAVAAIDAAVADDTSENVIEAAAQAKATIESAETVDDVQAAQTAGEQAIAKAKDDNAAAETAKQLQEAKDAAIAAIDAAVAGDTSANVTEAAASSKTAIGNAATAADVQAAQQAGLAAIAAAKEANAKPQTPETQAPVQEIYPAAGTALTLGDVTFVSQGDGTVIYQKVGKKAKKKLTTANIPAIVTIEGRNYRVIGIANGAFRNCKKLRKVTIGANVQMIGKKAFYGCGKLKKVVIQSQVLASAGKGVFGKTASNLVIKVPKPCKAAYQKMLKKTGISKKAKIR